MIDLINKSIITENNDESEKLLRMAVASGYSLPKGLKALTPNRFFRFIEFPNKEVLTPSTINREDALSFEEVFADEEEMANHIVEEALRFGRKFGYSLIRVYGEDTGESYTGHLVAKNNNITMTSSKVNISKPRKITQEEIEDLLGFPIEIIGRK